MLRTGHLHVAQGNVNQLPDTQKEDLDYIKTSRNLLDMLLSARPLRDLASVNSYEHATVFQFTQGDVVTIGFMLIDASLDTSSENFLPPGRRYMPATGATLQCVIESLDSGKKITRFATQPYPQDASIWTIQMLASDLISGTANLRLTLTEGTTVTRGVLKSAFRIQSQTNC